MYKFTGKKGQLYEIDEMKLEAEEERIPEIPEFVEETTTERVVSLDVRIVYDIYLFFLSLADLR